MDLDGLPPELEYMNYCVRCGRSDVSLLVAIDGAGLEYEARICQRCVLRRAAELREVS